jgi:hypothetical protein
MKSIVISRRKTMPDINGRPYAKLSDLKPGSFVTVDDGFSCMLEGVVFEVKADPKGSLYIDCSENGHTLDGQLAGDDNDQGHDPDELIGIYPVEESR